MISTAHFIICLELCSVFTFSDGKNMYFFVQTSNEVNKVKLSTFNIVKNNVQKLTTDSC